MYMLVVPEHIISILQTAGIPAGDLILWKGVTHLGNDAYQMLARIVQTSTPKDLHMLNEDLKEKFKLLRNGDKEGWQVLLKKEKETILAK